MYIFFVGHLVCLKNKLSLCLEINFLCIFSNNFMIMKSIRKYFGKSYIFNVLFRTIHISPCECDTHCRAS